MSELSFFAKLLPVNHCDFSDAEVISDCQLLQFENKVARFFGKANASYTGSGREAISLVLNKLNLTLDNEVFITTSFSYKNVSSCVTSTVFNFCKPSRVITNQTKAIFIIHEFGVFHPDTLKLIQFGRDHNLPVIEDCAHTPFSFDNNNNQTGKLGDYTIVSLPKVFPVMEGGLLVYGSNKLSNDFNLTSKHFQAAFIADKFWGTIDKIALIRKINFDLYLASINSIYFKPLINYSNDLFHWFFPVVTALDTLKTVRKLRTMGIEAGIWHGSDVIVLPLHQCLNTEDIIRVCNTLNDNLIWES